MDFTLSETQALVRKTARDFATREVAPRAMHLQKRLLHEILRASGVSYTPRQERR